MEKTENWFYALRDKDEKKTTPGNVVSFAALAVQFCKFLLHSAFLAVLLHVLFSCFLPAQAREMILADVKFSPSIVWSWKFAFDPVHAKLTAKKPTLVLNEALRLKSGQYVKLGQA